MSYTQELLTFEKYNGFNAEGTHVNWSALVYDEESEGKAKRVQLIFDFDEANRNEIDPTAEDMKDRTYMVPVGPKDENVYMVNTKGLIQVGMTEVPDEIPGEPEKLEEEQEVVYKTEIIEKKDVPQNTNTNTMLEIPPDVRLELSTENIINYLCPTATEQEAMMFIQLCANQGLDPFIGDAYLIKYGGKANMVVSKDAFMKKAEMQPDYEGFEAGIVVADKEHNIIKREGGIRLMGETLVGGWARVFRKNMKLPIVEVALHEYNSDKALWKDKPATMIRKTAISQAFREAYPNALQGMYGAEEMGVEINDN